MRTGRLARVTSRRSEADGYLLAGWRLTTRSVVAYSPPPAQTPFHAQPPRQRNQPLPPPARRESGGLVSVGIRGARKGKERGQADPSQHRLRRVSLVPRDGARIVRGRRHGATHEREVRQHQSRSRRASGHRRYLHAGRAGDDGARRLADDDVSTAGRESVLRRHVLPAGRPSGTAVVSPGSRIGERRLYEETSASLRD